MKKALIFLSATVLFFLVFNLIDAKLGNVFSYTSKGMVSIIIGLYFIIFPEDPVKEFFRWLSLPFSVIGTWLGLFSLIITAIICSVEALLPFVGGYYWVFCSGVFSSFTQMIAAMLFLTIWVALRNQHKQLITSTWDNGGQIMSWICYPFMATASFIEDLADHFKE